MTTGKAANSFKAELKSLISARYPLIHVMTHEEHRAIREIASVVAQTKQMLFFWSTSKGVFSLTDDDILGRQKRDPKLELDLADLAVALEFFEKKAKSGESFVCVLLDPTPYLNDKVANPIYRRRLRDFAINIRTKGYHSSCLMISPSINIPYELEKEITILDFPLPDREEIRHIIVIFLNGIKKSDLVSFDDKPEFIEQLIDALLGLTYGEIENALAKAVVDDLQLNVDDVERIFRQKQQIIRKSGILEYYDVHDLSLAEVGGLDVLKKWQNIREAAFSVEAQSYGILPPKGVLLTGVPGCGKSLSAKCAAASWRLPLVRLDMGKIYASLVGSSEERMRSAIQTCEAVAPCVLWIDEIEKGLPGRTRFVGDSGVSLRVLSSFLTWLQEKTAPVFVFATANQIEMLPPELLRKGRFDEIFFVDLPIGPERREILQIHIGNANRDPANYDLDELVQLSGAQGNEHGVALTGAEIASWVNEALIHSFYRRKQTGDQGIDLSMDDFRAVRRRLVPLAKLREADIKEMRDWADEHAIRASAVEKSAERGLVVGGRRLDL